MPFAALGLSPRTTGPLARLGYATPTDVQAQTIPAALQGNDVLARAQTGTGKTAAFGLPMIERLAAADHGQGAQAPRPGARAHARAGAAGAGVAARLRPGDPPARHDHGGRRADHAAGAHAAPRRRHRRRHARPPHRPPRPPHHRSVGGRDRRARRSRPHARHGLPAAAEAHHDDRAHDAPDAAALGDALEGDHRASRGRSSQDPVRIDVAPEHVVASTVVHRVYAVAQEQKRDLLAHVLTTGAAAPDAGVLPHEARLRPRRALPRGRGPAHRRHPRRQDARARASARSATSRPATCRCSSPPTWPRAGSTSRSCRWS